MARPTRDIPWLDQRDGVYNVCWYEKPGPGETKGRTKRIGLRTRDPVKAQALYAEFLSQGTDLLLRTGSASGITVSGALDAYDVEHVEKHVVDKKRQRFAIRYLTDYFGTTPLRDIDIPRCRAYVEARRAGTIGPRRAQPPSFSTIRKELSALMAASKHALRWKRISLADYPTFEVPPETDDGQEVPWFTRAEVDTLLAAAEGPLRDWILLAYWWGARRRSIERLEVYQVKLAEGTVNLQKAGSQVTKKRRPIVPIFPEIRPTLERLVKNAVGGFLFGPRCDFYREFRDLCCALGLDDKAWPHVLRHSRATHMLMAGENPYKVARLLGDTLKTIEQTYAHHSVDFLAE